MNERDPELEKLYREHSREEPPPALDAVRPDVPRRFAAIVGRLMEKDPAARYQRPAELVGDLAACAEAEGVRLPVGFADHVARVTLSRLRAEVRVTPHVLHALTWLRGPKAVASSSPLDRIRASLECTDLLRFFEPNVYSASHVPNGKPAPDLFLYAAAQMDVPPRDCMVVEDSRAGIAAACAAGMRVLGFAGGSHCGHQRPHRADADVREQHAGERGRVERREEEDEGGQRHDLRGEEEDERRERLPEPDGAAVARRQHEAVEDAVLLLGHPSTGEAEERGEHDRDPQEAVRRVVSRARR